MCCRIYESTKCRVQVVKTLDLVAAALNVPCPYISLYIGIYVSPSGRPPSPLPRSRRRPGPGPLCHTPVRGRSPVPGPVTPVAAACWPAD